MDFCFEARTWAVQEYDCFEQECRLQFIDRVTLVKIIEEMESEFNYSTSRTICLESRMQFDRLND